VKHKARFAGWIILTGVIVPLGFYRGWSSFDYIALGVLAVYGIVLAFSTVGGGFLIRRIATMSPAEREEFMAQFSEEERQELTAKLQDYVDRQKSA
jgi:hypothetical protein